MHWNTQYDRVYRRLFWNPALIAAKRIVDLCDECAKKKPAADHRSANIVLQKALSREDVFNDFLSIFFDLVPREVVLRLLKVEARERSTGQFSLVNEERYFGEFENVTQPDFMFVEEGTVLFVEMKLDAKCDIQQVVKYALLSACHAETSGRKHETFFVLLGKNLPFDKLWRERFVDWEAVKTGLSTFDPDRHEARPAIQRQLKDRWPAIREVLNGMKFSTLSYQDLDSHIHDEIRRISPRRSDGDRTLARLLEGVSDELGKRGLRA